MTATEELRRLLDEQGIEYREYQPNPFEETTAWDLDVSDIRHEVWASFEEFDSGSTLLRFWSCTPEQAIAATLGPGTCYAIDSGYATAFCSVCGAEFMGSIMTNEPPDYVKPLTRCPECGRKIVEVTDG